MKPIWIWMLGMPGLFAEVPWPPELPGGKPTVVVESGELLEPITDLREGVVIAKTPPRVEFYYYDCQTYEGKPWSVWGDALFANGKYYSSVGDHRSPGGNAFVYEFDPASRKLRRLTDVRSVLGRPDGWYTPGKIHSSLGMGKDGWIYFSTHRGSTKVAMDPKNHYEGDWIMKVDPATGKSEVVSAAPLEMQCLPTGILDGGRMIWYAGTADGLNQKSPKFLAYDVESRKILHSDDHGPHRAMILSSSTGRMYFHGGPAGEGKGKAAGAELYRFDPSKPGAPEPIGTKVGLRAASSESPDGKVYTIEGDALWSFDVRTETATPLGPSAVGIPDYTTNLDIDPTGRYLYYIPGAHGGAEKDGTPVVQYDLRNRTRKVICFLHPALKRNAGYIPIGSFGSALSSDGSTLFVTWNGAHKIEKEGKRVPFQSVAMTAITIPESERKID
jgi:hypothetical protein